MRALLLALPALALSGCVTVHPPDMAGTCHADAAQSYIGRTASAEVGADLLRLTHARQLRWVAPGMTVTMDYRGDRLTVSYDQAMRITNISCG